MQYFYYSEGQFKVARNPVTGTKCRTGQLNHKFVEQQLINGIWTDIGGNDAIAGEGCRFREGARAGDYVVDVELEVAGFLLAENDGWENIGGSSGSYWTPRSLGTKILFWGKVSEISGGQMPNEVGSDYLTVAGSPATYQAPDTAPYKSADTDYIWFRTDALQRTVTTAELIGYDLQRTPVKYLDDVPNTLEEIVIIKAGESLTVAEANNLHIYMHLSIYWSGSLNGNGVIKSNRPIPTILTAEIESGIPTKVLITLDEALDETSIPATTDFTLAGKTISNVAISGAVVTLTVTVGYIDEVVTVEYAKPMSNGLKSLSFGVAVNSFTVSVVNNLYGPDIVVNGDFGSAVGWTLGAGWNIANGVATGVGAGEYLVCNTVITIGKTYLVKFNVNKNGENGVFLSSWGHTISFNQGDTYINQELIADDVWMGFWVNTGTTLIVDNVVIKEKL